MAAPRLLFAVQALPRPLKDQLVPCVLCIHFVKLLHSSPHCAMTPSLFAALPSLHFLCLLPTAPSCKSHSHWCQYVQVFTACAPRSRTTGGALVRQTVGKFLDRYHSPTAVLAAPGADICRTITSVGLQARAGVLFSLSLSLLSNSLS